MIQSVNSKKRTPNEGSDVSTDLKRSKKAKEDGLSVGGPSGSDMADKMQKNEVRKAGTKEEKINSYPRKFVFPSKNQKEELRTLCESLGKDSLSKAPFISLLSEAHRNFCPYVFAEIELKTDQKTKNKRIVHADANAVYLGFLNSRSLDFTEKKKNIFPSTKEIIGDVTFRYVTPWNAKPSFLGTIEDLASDEIKDGIFTHYVLGLRDEKPDDIDSYTSRGTAFLMFKFGIGVPKDQNVANFLVGCLTDKQRKRVFTETLSMAAQYYTPDLVKACLQHGANPAPAYSSDEFLALTMAVIGGGEGGNVENVKLLLAAGADPRQQADSSHGTALSWSYAGTKPKPEIQNLLEKNLKERGKDRELVMWAIDGKWVEINPKMLTNDFAAQNGYDPVDWSSSSK